MKRRAQVQPHAKPNPVSLPLLALSVITQACGLWWPLTPDPLQSDGGTGVAGRRVAIVHTDYKSASVSLYDAASGALLREDCVNSGTAQPAPALSLSGDLVLPSAPQAGGELLLIDRGNAALTWMDPVTCAPRRQLSVGISGQASFESNPQDVLSISPTKAYVTRLRRNPTPSPQADDFDEGEDVLVVDPSVPAVKGRIALAGEALPAATGEATQAMPGRGVVVGRYAYVTIGSLEVGYQKAGPGRVAIIDVETDAIVGRLELPSFTNCHQASTDASKSTLVIGCGGVYADGPGRSAQSAFVAFDLSSFPPAPVRTWAPDLFGGRPIAMAQSAQLLSATRGVTVVSGEWGKTPTDGLWLFDGASATKLADSTTSFDFGQVLADAVGQRVLFTDAAASTPRLRRFDVSSGTPTEEPALDSSPSTGLPPRYLGWY